MKFVTFLNAYWYSLKRIWKALFLTIFRKSKYHIGHAIHLFPEEIPKAQVKNMLFTER